MGGLISERMVQTKGVFLVDGPTSPRLYRATSSDTCLLWVG